VGERRVHSDLRIGYFAQHTVESLREGATPMDHLRDIAPEATTQEMRSFLGKWYFPAERAFQCVDVMSGGERARLALALIAWRKPNVLLLDEPTNHLDLDMREALAEALSDFDGAIVLVSHDRHLIGLVCDTFWRVADHRVEPFAGDLDGYAAWLRARSGKTEKDAEPVKASPPPKAASPPKTDAKRSRRLKDIEKLEQRIAVLGSDLAQLESSLQNPALYSDNAAEFARLTARHSEVGAQHAALEAQWLEAYAQLEAG
jgi:ATP-binding cassette subfamily F protein 3